MWQNLENITSQVITSVGGALSVLLNGAVDLTYHLYMVLVRQQLLIGTQILIKGISLIFTAWLVSKLIRFILKKKNLAVPDRYTISAVLLIVLSVLLVTGASAVIESIPRIANPEYYAIQDGIRLLNQAKQ